MEGRAEPNYPGVSFSDGTWAPLSLKGGLLRVRESTRVEGEAGPSWKKSRSSVLIGVASTKEAFEFGHQESQRGDARGFFCLWACERIQI